MTDQFGRDIRYMRISITDRCNLRCRYCMPQGVQSLPHDEILSYEEILRVCREAVAMGITHFRVTGGEPLVRRGCTDFVGQLKTLPGVETVALTTNGILLGQKLDALCTAGVDGVNISLDSLDPERYGRLTATNHTPGEVLEQVERCVEKGVPVKLNAVLLDETAEEIPHLADLAARLSVDVRFIELMPIGLGASMTGIGAAEALVRLQRAYPDLHQVDECRGSGPARYWASGRLLGRIGFITAVSREFCGGCNRVRLTSTGQLKPCLCFEEGADLRRLLRQGAAPQELRAAMAACIAAKPRQHCFARRRDMTEHHNMNQIGG